VTKHSCSDSPRGTDPQQRMPSCLLFPADPLRCSTASNGSFPSRQVTAHSG